jgi:membrane-bound ClpP family serine protease
MVYVEGELWAATAEGLAEGESIPAGTNVEVVEVNGLRLTVRRTSASLNAEVAQASRRESLVPVQGYP